MEVIKKSVVLREPNKKKCAKNFFFTQLYKQLEVFIPSAHVAEEKI